MINNSAEIEISWRYFMSTTGMSYIWGESPKGHLLSVNLLATPKPDYREVAGRGRDSEIVALRIETR